MRRRAFFLSIAIGAAIAAIAPADSREDPLRARARLHVSAALTELERGDVATALALVLETLPRGGPSDRNQPNIPEAKQALRRIIQSPVRELRAFTHSNAAGTANFSPTGLIVSVESVDGPRYSDMRWGGIVFRLHERFSTSRLIEPRSGRTVATFLGTNRAVSLRDGIRILTIGDDHAVRLVNRTTGAQLAVFRGNEERAVSIAISADERHVAIGSLGGTVLLWGIGGGQPRAILRTAAGPVNTVAFSADGRTFAAGGYDAIIRLWSTEDGRELRQLTGHKHPISRIAFVLDGDQLASFAEGERAALIWDTRTGTSSALAGHDEMLADMIASPDGRSIITSSYDKTARLWDIKSGALLTVFRGHEKPVLRAKLSHDKAQLATLSFDLSLRIWDAVHGHQLAMLRPQWDGEFGPAELDWSKDGLIVAAFGDRTSWIVQTWPDKPVSLPEDQTQALVDQACSMMVRPLTREQRRSFGLDENPTDPPCGWHPDMVRKPPYQPKAAVR